MNGSYTTILLRQASGDRASANVPLPVSHFYIQDSLTGDVVFYPESVSAAPHAADLFAAVLAEGNSRATVLLYSVQEGETMRLRLWEQGIPTDEYIPEPGYDTGEELPPFGGDAARLCAAFGVIDAESRAELDDVLNAGRYDEFYGYNNAQERHRDIVELLGLASASIGFDYDDLAHGAMPEGVTKPEEIHPVAITSGVSEYVIFASAGDTSEAEIAARFLPHVISYEEEFLNEDTLTLGSAVEAKQRFSASGWTQTTSSNLLRYMTSNGTLLLAEPQSDEAGWETAIIWNTGASTTDLAVVWEALCRKSNWGVWDYQTRRVVFPPAA